MILPGTETPNAAGARQRNRRCSGFTLAELLFYVLLISLVMSGMLTVFELSIRHFRDRTLDAKAGMLCDALAVSLRSKLFCATEARLEDGELTVFRSNANDLGAFYTKLIGPETPFINSRGKVTRASVWSAVYLEGPESEKAVVDKAVPLVDPGEYRTKFGDTLSAHIRIEYRDGAFQVTVAVMKNASPEGGVIVREKQFEVRPVAEVRLMPPAGDD